MRLALGTAQFGIPYGVANRTGQVTLAEGAAILDEARRHGVDTLDTAIAYGSSESALGEIGVAGWRVVTKIPALPDACADVPGTVAAAVAGSLERLRVERLYGVLLHRPAQLLGPYGDALYGALVALRDQGIVDAIGVSVYGPSELDALWPRFAFDLIQAPYSVLDRRMESSGWFARLHEAGVEIHARSAFLQGLLLMEPAARPEFTHRWQPLLSAWDAWADGDGGGRLQACLGFVGASKYVDRVVVGVDGVAQLREILAAASAPARIPPSTLASDDEDLLHPGRWVAA